jgi:hypothetical protein
VIEKLVGLIVFLVVAWIAVAMIAIEVVQQL